MRWLYQRFASQEQITRWRLLSLFEGWEVSGYLEVLEDEVRLFDAPIANGFLAPRFRISELAYSRLIPGDSTGGSADEELVRISSGWLYATDRRFVIPGKSAQPADDIPFRRINQVEYKNGDFLLTMDRQGIVKDRLLSKPAPPKPFGMSEQEYATSTLLPAYLKASYHAVGTVLIRTAFPKSGLLDAITIIGAPTNAERFWYADMVQRKNQSGQEFLTAFFYFLNEIADKNRMS